MIRFIDIGDQIMDECQAFAWYDTVTDSFIECSSDQVWDSWEEFVVSHEWEPNPRPPLERFRSLFPKIRKEKL